MRVISFDVGIKNLAYCYFGSECKTIIDWCVVDLSDDKRTCSFVTGCGKNATYAKSGLFFCNKHCKEYLKQHTHLRVPPEKLCRDSIAELSSTKLKKLASSLGVTVETSAGVGRARANTEALREAVLSYTESHLMECVMTRNAKDIDLVEIGRNLDKHFSQLFCDTVSTGLLRPDIVIIENQISPIANRMKTIQGMIAQFFITHFRGADIPVKFISSSNKLKDFVSPVASDDGGTTEGTTYDERKKTGVTVTRELLSSHPSNNTRWTDVFEKSAKKDDLADSFLQGLWYTRHVIDAGK